MSARRIAVMSDIHGNIPALEAVLADISARGIADLVNLGDLVSGPLWPRETFEALRNLGIPTVRGNHDRWVATLSRDAMGLSDRNAADSLTEVQRAWLGALPASIELEGGILAIHGRPSDDNAYLLERVVAGHLVAAPAPVVTRRLGDVSARLVLCGHSHQQNVVSLPAGPSVLNPGSVGCPAYADAENIPHVSQARSPHARYAVLTLDGERVRADLVLVDYDWASAARRARSNDRGDWAEGLETGFLPDA